MSYIGNSPSQTAFLTDQFSGTGSQTAFTMSVAPANTASCIVAVSGVLQDPSTYAVAGTTLNFTVAPPTGSGNISVRYLGIPASGVTTTAYRTVTEFTATASQTTFTPPSYTVGYLNVYRNGVLLGSADYTATTGTSVVLATGCVAGDLVTTESFLVSSVLNAIPNTTGSISSSNLPAGLTINTPTITSPTISTSASLPANTTLNSLNLTPYTMKNRIINGGMVIDQRNAGASQTITGGASTLAFNCDRWQVRSQGANATVQQVATNNTYRMVFTGLASNTGVAASQSIEAVNCADMAGQTVTLSLLAKSTSLTSLTLEAYYANTTNTFGTWGSPTVTSIGTQSVTISATESLVSYTFAVPAAATTGLQIRITSGALAATQTLSIGNVQLEVGSYATPFEWRPYGTELQLCQRYYAKMSAFSGNNYCAFGVGMWISSNTPNGFVKYPVSMRSAPTISYGGTLAVSYGAGSLTNITSVNSVYAGTDSALWQPTTGSVATAGQAGTIMANNDATCYVAFASEL